MSYVQKVAYDRRVVTPGCSQTKKGGGAGMSELPKLFSPTYDVVTALFMRSQLKCFLKCYIKKKLYCKVCSHHCCEIAVFDVLGVVSYSARSSACRNVLATRLGS